MKEVRQASELVIIQRDIDFTDKTVSVLTRDLLKQIHIASKAVCETPQAFKLAIETGLAKIGGYRSEQGDWIYIHLNNHNYVIPYVRNH